MKSSNGSGGRLRLLGNARDGTYDSRQRMAVCVPSEV
jgi:hypothetical protein